MTHAHACVGLDVLIQAIGIVQDCPSTGKRKRGNHGGGNRLKSPQPLKRLQTLEVLPKYIVLDNTYWQRRDSWRATFAPALRDIKRAAPNLRTQLRIAQAKQLFEIMEEDRATCTKSKNADDAQRLEASIAWVTVLLQEVVTRIDARGPRPATPPASPLVTVAMPPGPPPPLPADAMR